VKPTNEEVKPDSLISQVHNRIEKELLNDYDENDVPCYNPGDKETGALNNIDKELLSGYDAGDELSFNQRDKEEGVLSNNQGKVEVGGFCNYISAPSDEEEVISNNLGDKEVGVSNNNQDKAEDGALCTNSNTPSDGSNKEDELSETQNNNTLPMPPRRNCSAHRDPDFFMDVMDGPSLSNRQEKLNTNIVMFERCINKYKGGYIKLETKDHPVQEVHRFKCDKDIGVISPLCCEPVVIANYNKDIRVTPSSSSELGVIAKCEKDIGVILSSCCESGVNGTSEDNECSEKKTNVTIEGNDCSERNMNSLRTNEDILNEGLTVSSNDPAKKLMNNINHFKIFHQNIRGIKTKVIELLNSFSSDYPQIICVTEHHLKDFELTKLPIEHYKLRSKYCRKNYKNGGVCIFAQESLEFSPISLDKYCVEKDIEICALKVLNAPIHITILAMYRAPSGNFNIFFKNLETILNLCYTNNSILVICGDININYLDNCTKRQQLDILLQTYNLKAL
jgi:hypothetical protein